MPAWNRLPSFEWPPANRVARQLGDVGIAACLWMVPLWFGGRHDLGRLLYAVAVAFAVVGVFSHAALVGRCVRIPRLLLAVLGGSVGLVTLQLIPLPDSVFAWLAPEQAALPMLGANGSWRTLSFSPAETREGLALLLTHALLLVAVVVRLETIDDIRCLLRWVAWATLGGAAIALAQHVVPNGKLLWLYQHPHVDVGGTVQGTFTNRNHFAHLMALGLGPVCLLALRALRNPNPKKQQMVQMGWLRLLTIGSIALPVVAALATQSRGGVAAIAVAMLVLTIGVARSGSLKLPQVAGLVGVALITLAGVSFLGYDQIASRLDDLVSGEVETLDSRGSRRAIWAANVAAWQASPWIGFGAGSHRDVYPLFFDTPTTKEFTHAESGYLQVASETGTLGLVVLFAAIGLCASWLFRSFWGERNPDNLHVGAAIAAGLVASLVHAGVDFVWYVPALMAVTLILAGCALRLAELHGKQASGSTQRPGRGAIAAPSTWLVPGFAVMLMFLALGTLSGPARGALDWDRYLRCSRGLRGMVHMITNDPSRADPHLADTILQNTAYSVELLERVVASDPNNGRAHLRLAGRLLQQFELESSRAENRMPVELIRDAALNGGFQSKTQMLGWLDRAFGERALLLRRAHAHARRAAMLTPLDGEAYLCLASLAFLEPPGTDITGLIDRALAVRPHAGDVLFESARQLQILGQSERAFALWRRCVRLPGSHQHKLVALLAGVLPASTFIETFEPGPVVLGYATKHYKLVGDEHDLRALADHAHREALRAEAEGQPAKRLAYRWRHVSETYRSLGDAAQSVEAAQRAQSLAPHILTMRLELAHALRAAERFDEADPHIRWCLARRPDIRYLQRWLADASKRRTVVDQNRRTRHSLFAEKLTRDVTSEVSKNSTAQRAEVKPTNQR